VRRLSDYTYENEEVRLAVTKLGLDYELLTQYTSFVAVHEVVRNPDGQAKNVDQPLPLPQGVSDSAVAVPEPELPLRRRHALTSLRKRAHVPIEEGERIAPATARGRVPDHRVKCMNAAPVITRFAWDVERAERFFEAARVIEQGIARTDGREERGQVARESRDLCPPRRLLDHSQRIGELESRDVLEREAMEIGGRGITQHAVDQTIQLRAFGLNLAARRADRRFDFVLDFARVVLVVTTTREKERDQPRYRNRMQFHRHPLVHEETVRIVVGATALHNKFARSA
jgi:hypothetical protein